MTTAFIFRQAGSHFNFTKLRLACLGGLMLICVALGFDLYIPTWSEVVFVCDQNWEAGRGVAEEYLKALPGPAHSRAISTVSQFRNTSNSWETPVNAEYTYNLESGLFQAEEHLHPRKGISRVFSLLFPVKRRIVFLSSQSSNHASINKVYDLISRCAEDGVSVDVIDLAGHSVGHTISLTVPGGRIPSMVIYHACHTPLLHIQVPPHLLGRAAVRVTIEMSIPKFGRAVATGDLPAEAVRSSASQDDSDSITITRDWFINHLTGQIPLFETSRFQGIGEIRSQLELNADGRKIFTPIIPVMFEPDVLVKVADAYNKINLLPLYGFYRQPSATNLLGARALAISTSSLDSHSPGALNLAAFVANGGLLIVSSTESLLGRNIPLENGTWKFHLPAPANDTIRGMLWDVVGNWYSWPTESSGEDGSRAGGLDINLVPRYGTPQVLVDQTEWTPILNQIQAIGGFVDSLSNLQHVNKRLDDMAMSLGVPEPDSSEQWLSTTWQQGRHVIWVSDGQIPASGKEPNLSNDAGRALALADVVDPMFRGTGIAAYDPILHYRTNLTFASSNLRVVTDWHNFPSDIILPITSALRVKSPFEDSGFSGFSHSGPTRFAVIGGGLNATPVAWVRMADNGPFKGDLPAAVIGYYGKGLIACFGFGGQYTDIGTSDDPQLMSVLEGLTARGHLASVPFSANAVGLIGVAKSDDGMSLNLVLRNAYTNVASSTVSIPGQSFHVTNAPLTYDDSVTVSVPRAKCGSAGSVIQIASTPGTDTWPITLLEASQSDEDISAALRELALATGGHYKIDSATMRGYLRRVHSGVIMTSATAAFLSLIAIIAWYFPGCLSRLRSLRELKLPKRAAGSDSKEVSGLIDLNSSSAVMGGVGEYVRRRAIEVGDSVSSIDKTDLAVQAVTKVNLLPRVLLYRREMSSPIQIVVDISTRLIGGAIPRVKRMDTMQNVADIAALFVQLGSARRCPVELACLSSKNKLAGSPAPKAAAIAKWLIKQPMTNVRNLSQFDAGVPGARLIMIGSFTALDLADLTTLNNDLHETGGGVGVVHLMTKADTSADENIVENALAGWADRSIIAPKTKLSRLKQVEDWRMSALSNCTFGSMTITLGCSQREIIALLREQQLMEVFV